MKDLLLTSMWCWWCSPTKVRPQRLNTTRIMISFASEHPQLDEKTMVKKAMSSYFLSSERLGFRCWTQDDFELAKELWGDPAVTRLFSKLPLSDIEVQERLHTEIKRASSDGIQYWPIFELTTGEHIGCAGLRPYKPA